MSVFKSGDKVNDSTNNQNPEAPEGALKESQELKAVNNAGSFAVQEKSMMNAIAAKSPEQQLAIHKQLETAFEEQDVIKKAALLQAAKKEIYNA